MFITAVDLMYATIGGHFVIMLISVSTCSRNRYTCRCSFSLHPSKATPSLTQTGMFNWYWPIRSIITCSQKSRAFHSLALLLSHAPHHSIGFVTWIRQSLGNPWPPPQPHKLVLTGLQHCTLHQLGVQIGCTMKGQAPGWSQTSGIVNIENLEGRM